MKESNTVNLFLQLEQKIVSWLVRDYRQRLLRKAIRRAHMIFERQYPTWATSYFDEHFLMHKALPLLQGYLDGNAPDAVTFATAMVDGLWNWDEGTLHRLSSKSVPVAAAFLALVATELRAAPLQTIRDPQLA